MVVAFYAARQRGRALARAERITDGAMGANYTDKVGEFVRKLEQHAERTEQLTPEERRQREFEAAKGFFGGRS